MQKQRSHYLSVMLFVNSKTGSSSVLEAPSIDSGPFKGLVCFISIGVQTKLTFAEMGQNTHLISHKGIDFLRPMWYK